MCGISGFSYSSNELHDVDAKNIIDSMIRESFHRGPDSQGSYLKNGIAFGHTRLSFRDLSDSGSQPMEVNNSHVMVFNGEIYNDEELRKHDSDYKYKSNSDTESLLVSIHKNGIHDTLKKIKGMYAFAVYDVKNHEIILARDPCGEKPLYYCVDSNQNLYFASDIFILSKALKNQNKISKKNLNEYFTFGFIPSSETIFKNINKVKPGTFLRFKLDKMQKVISKDEKVYFEYKKQKIRLNKKAINNQIEEYISKSIESQLISDVPVGCLLSGGLDSTLIAYYASKIADYKISTFTIGYSDKRYDESLRAKLIADKLNTNHFLYKPTKDDLIEAVTECTNIFSEPFGDTSQIPAYIICKFASQHVKAVLTGDGGDEIFGGYNRYFNGYKAWKLINFLNKFGLKGPTDKFLSYLVKATANIDKQSLFGINNFDKKIKKLKGSIQHQNLDMFYLNLLSSNQISKNNNILNKSFRFDSNHLEILPENKSFNTERQLMTHYDLKIYLSENNLVKMDRVSMYNSLEVRCPFLNKDLIDFMTSLPDKYKFNAKHTKPHVRKILQKTFSASFLNSPKMGFSIPIDQLLRNELREWAYGSIFDNRLEFIDYDNVSKIWKSHIDGTDYSEDLWKIISFSNWHNITKQKLNENL